MLEPLRILATTAQPMAFIPLIIPQADIRSVMGPGLAELRAAIAAEGVAVTGPWFTHHLRPPGAVFDFQICLCLLYTSPSPRDRQKSRMPSSA